MLEEKKDTSYDDLLLELMLLKKTDYDQFMSKLYEAINGEFKNALHNADPVPKKTKALNTMIQYFESKEEYEKCATLKKMVESLNA